MAKPAKKSQRNKQILPGDFKIPSGLSIRATQWYIKGAEEAYLGKKDLQETVSKLIAPDAGRYFALGYEAGCIYKQSQPELCSDLTAGQLNLGSSN